MKKFVSVLFTFLLALVFTISLSSCTKVVYQPSVDNDVATNAYKAAVNEGYEGTFSDWLIELLISGEYDSIYNLAVESGIFEGTMEEFIASLKGDKGSSSLIDATQKALVSSVSIYCTFNVKSTSKSIFGEQATTEAVSVTGSGVIYTKDDLGNAYIITNYHVIYNVNATPLISSNIRVCLYGMEYEKFLIDATYIGGTMQYDIAVLKIQSDYLAKDSGYPYQAVTVGDSSNLIVGDSIIAVGNARGRGISVNNGIISVPNDNISMTLADEKTSANIRVIRMDALINAGNSGGGLFNNEGVLIGITNAKNVQENTEGLCYAIPINIAKAIANNIIKNCDGDTKKTIERVYLGVIVEIDDSKPTYDDNGNLKIVQKIKISSVDSASVSAGKLETGDILKFVTYDGEMYPVLNLHSIEDVLLNVSVGESVVITFERNGVDYIQEITFTSGTAI